MRNFFTTDIEIQSLSQIQNTGVLSKLWLLTLLVASSHFALGQISIPALGTPLTQDFNTLASSGTSSSVPADWAFVESGTGADATYAAGSGTETAGDTYSYGTGAAVDRAFGGLRSGAVTPTIGASYTNNTGGIISRLLIAYTGEQWRLGATARVDRLDFQYSTDATSLTTGTWINANSLDFTAPVTTGTVGGLNGNSASNRTAISNSISGLSIPNGATFWIRWVDFDATGADDGLAVDDFSLTARNGDYLLTTTGNTVVLTDVSGNSETINIQPNVLNLNFNVTGRTYSLNGAAATNFPALILLAGVTSITVNAGAGNDIIHFVELNAALPNLTLNGGTGNDEVVFFGDLSFAPNANLNIDLQNDDDTPGQDRVTVTPNANLVLSGTGSVTIRVSRNVDFQGGSGIETANGDIVIEANQQATPTAGNFEGVKLDLCTLEVSGTGSISVIGKGGNTPNNQYGVFLRNGAKIMGGTVGTVTVNGAGGSASGTYNHGVVLTSSTAMITSVGASINVTGQGGGVSASGFNMGVFIETGAIIHAGGNGTVDVTGIGGATSGTTNYGIQIVNANSKISSFNGNVSVTGTGGGASASSNNVGVFVHTAAAIRAGGAGMVTVTGTGGIGSNAANHGVYVYDANSIITASGGAVSVIGQGGGSGGSSENKGVFVSTGGVIAAESSGPVSVTGTGGTATGSENPGIEISGANSAITSAGGNISLMGQGGGAGNSYSNYGIAIRSAGVVSAGGSGTIQMTGTGGLTSGNSNIGIFIYNANSKVITSNGNISITGTGGGITTASYGHGVSVQLGGFIMAGGSGTVTVEGAGCNSEGGDNYGVRVAETSATISSAGGNVSVTGQGGGSGVSDVGHGVRVELSGIITAENSGTVSVMGIGGAGAGNSNNGVTVQNANSRISSSGGNVQVTGQGGSNGLINNYGVFVFDTGVITAGGSGTVVVNGNGGNTVTGGGSVNFGVFVNSAGSFITSSGGNVSVTGYGGGAGSSTPSAGVHVSNAGIITAGTTGSVTVVGYGGNLTGTGGFNSGIEVNGVNSRITSSGGNVFVTGTGGGGNNAANNYGVYVANTGTITAGGSGTVMVTGNGGTTTGATNIGCYVRNANSTITSSGGNVLVTGTGGGTGSSANNTGVLVLEGAIITAALNGTVTVVGMGGNTTGNDNFGTFVSGTNSRIQSNNGNVNVTGTGGGTGSSGGNYGVYVHNNAAITAGSTRTVTVTGTGGNAAGANNFGVLVTDPASRITSSGGVVSVTGIEGGGSSPVGIVTQTTGGITTAASGAHIALIANSIDLQNTSLVSTHSGSNTTMRPYTTGVPINLGSATNPAGGPLSLSDEELDRVTTGALIIGNANSGAITVSEDISRTAATAMQLISNDDISISGGQINTNNGALLLDPGAAPAAIKPTQSNVDVRASTLSFAGALAIVINGTTVDAQFNQLNVIGAINLTGASLNLSGSYLPIGGTTFTIVNNDASDAITGAFTGLPQGATITNFLGSTAEATISYTGGTGNDVVISVVNNDITCYADIDGDGFGDLNNSQVFNGSCGAGYVTDNTDCNNNDNTVYPSAPELCDNKDNDCNSLIDDGLLIRYYYDNDHDGYGESTDYQDRCSGPTGLYTALVGDDCNDNDDTIYPNAPELCDGKDNDCNGLTDDGLTFTHYYYDNDQDGYGQTNAFSDLCASTGFYTALVGGDCTDSDVTVYPDAPELCDGKDNNCDGSTDEGVTTRYYYDFDQDGYGQSDAFDDLCAPTGLYTALVDGDCTDSDNTVYPTALEICDDKDNDCNSLIDDGVTTRYYYDNDGDGYGESIDYQDRCSGPTGLYTALVGGDCNDNNATIYPDAPELCDIEDNDCDGMTDEDLIFTRYYLDLDGDGYGQTSTFNDFCAASGFYTALVGGDCNDDPATGGMTNPAAMEICNDIDDDCDGMSDEGLPTTRYYYDFDGDGYGEAVAFIDACAPNGLYTATMDGDCTADNADIYPGATEICDGIDNNCDGVTDEGLVTLYFYDNDGDGFGQNLVFVEACAPGGLYTATVGGDCNDDPATGGMTNPAAMEVCNDIDDDCDGMTDNGFPIVRYYYDGDDDGFGDSSAFRDICGPIGFYTTTIGGDCNGDDHTIYPDAPELCDGIDNNCDDQTDEGLTFITYFTDADGDGYGTGEGQSLCANPGAGFATQASDCNDNDDSINPGESETCDGIDNNCDGQTEEGLTFITYYTDADGDGYGTGEGQSLCANPGAGFATQDGDCNDNDDSINPGETEICDGVDNNCDTQTDEGLTFTTYYTDVDGDGYGTGSGQSLCANPGAGFAIQAGDCNDNNAAINPGETEICDGMDNNCDGIADEGLKTEFHADLDGDGFGDPNSVVIECIQPQGYVANNDDCDDTDDSVNPDTEEVCDSKDNDCNGVIDDVGGAFTGTWNNGNVGNANGSANFPPCNAGPDDTFVINSTGFSTSSSDKLHAVYQTLCGNGEIIAHVVNVTSGGWAGVMLRETLDPGSKKVSLKTQLSTNIRREIRTVTNGAVTMLNFSRPQHTWFRLVRNGSNFVGYTSTNGSTWSFAFSATVSMNGCIYVGIFSESINASVTTTATFDNVSIIGATQNLGSTGVQLTAGSDGQMPQITTEVYPNPTDGRVMVSFTNISENHVTIRVFNALGEQVRMQQTEVLEKTTTQLNLANLADGVYTLRIEAQGQVAVSKRIVLAKSNVRP